MTPPWDALQRRLADTTHRAGRQFEAATLPADEALAFQFLLQRLERAQVVDGVAPERPAYRLGVDIADARMGGIDLPRAPRNFCPS